jgi:hypothetical protein
VNVDFWLICAALAVSAWRCDWLAAAMAASFAAHSVARVYGYLDPYGYYLSAALLDAFFVWIIYRMPSVTFRLKVMQWVLCAFVSAQVFGIITYWYFVSPIYYNAICAVLYLALITTIISRDKKRARNRKDSKLRIVHDSAIGHGSAMAAKDEAKG